MTESERQRFEAWITAPPYERGEGVGRYPDDGETAAWPGHYVDYQTQLAWEAWQQAGAAAGRDADLRVAVSHACEMLDDIAAGVYFAEACGPVAKTLRAALDAPAPSASTEYARGLRDAAKVARDLKTGDADYRSAWDYAAKRIDALAAAAEGAPVTAGEVD